MFEVNGCIPYLIHENIVFMNRMKEKSSKSDFTIWALFVGPVLEECTK